MNGNNIVLFYSEAVTKAGFCPLRVINEPTAALLAYDIGQKDPQESL